QKECIDQELVDQLEVAELSRMPALKPINRPLALTLITL
ncbi:uncharacterized protein METZ01_LOCUS506199, partial [marine metagenome]